ncbi:MAG: CocE/NonD family hydrolase [Gemmatimonadaceae bacterium]|nr:CocE/NonD family hydrolase [Gemmatimonadaceae bacterium]
MVRTLLAACALWVSTAPAQAVDSTVAVVMRDGVVLRAIVLRPAAAGRFPTLVYRTPYGAESALRDYSTFHAAVARGYAVVLQDVRGRYRSDGDFLPYRQEGVDGFDTIEWAAAQPWSTGEVGTFGLSYPGAVQWLAAMENPPHLKAMVPAMTFSRPDNFWYSGGALDLSWLSWIWFNIAPDERRRRDLPGPRTRRDAAAAWDSLGPRLVARLPARDVPEILAVAPWYREWMDHAPGDPWWRWADLRGRYGRTSAAVLNISGWHDEAYGPEGATTNFLGLLEARRDADDARAFLILGPWQHGVGAIVNRSDSARAGERFFGRTAGLNYDSLVLRFMDRYVRGMSNGLDAEPRVRAFVMGENRWRTANQWPVPGTDVRTFALSAPAPAAARSTARVAPRRGTLGARTTTVRTWSLVSDPSRPIVDPFDASYGAHDFRALADHAETLAFDSAPFERDTRVLGRIVVRLAVRLDVVDSTAPPPRDADVYVRLFDVAPDGTAWNLMSPGLELTRLSVARGGRMLAPGEVAEVNIGHHLTGNLFRAGHRLRAVVLPSFHPHFGLNPQTGARETDAGSVRRARITVLTGGAHRSEIEVPVVAGER